MERGFWIVITIVLSMPIWLLMYDELVPDVINETSTVYVEPDLDCAECIEICHGTTYEGTIESAANTNSHDEMRTNNPVLWDNMSHYFVDSEGYRIAPSFKEAFRSARDALGSDEIFKWDGKYYTTDYKEELEVANQSID